jgi:hypothetical protein
MSHLVPCPDCNRHVESAETTCPFCQAALAPRPACTGCRSGPPAARVASAALVAAGVALLGAACQSQSAVVPYGVPPQFDAGTESDADAGEPTDGPPPDSGDDTK